MAAEVASIIDKIHQGERACIFVVLPDCPQNNIDDGKGKDPLSYEGWTRCYHFGYQYSQRFRV